MTIPNVLGAVGAGFLGFGKDQERRKAEAAQKIKDDRDAERQKILNALTGAQTTQVAKETDLLGQPKGPPATVSPGQGVLNPKTGTYDVPVPDTPAADRFSFPVGQDETGKPIVLRANTRTGEVSPTDVGAKPTNAGRPTEAQMRANLVVPRAEQGAKNLEEFYDDGAPTKTLLQRVPILGNFAMNEEEQRMVQAAEAVASAILRLESGAAITESEIQSYAKQFLPVPGDSPEVRAQKKESLMQQIAAMRNQATLPAPTTDAPAKKQMTPQDAEMARKDPGFAAWLKSQGYEVP